MDSIEAAEMKVTVAEEKAERKACEAEIQAFEVEQEFQWQKKHADAMMDDTESSVKAEGGGMTNTSQCEVQVTVKARMKITNPKESFRTKLIDMKDDSHVRVHWL